MPTILEKDVYYFKRGHYGLRKDRHVSYLGTCRTK